MARFLLGLIATALCLVAFASFASATEDSLTPREEESIVPDNDEDPVETVLAKTMGSVELPGGAHLQLDGEDGLTLRWPAQEEGRKSKLKKILIPVLVFVLLKAITLVPLFIGVLGVKAWNGLQLSFFSFVISVALAVFQLCKKIAADPPTPITLAAAPAAAWEPTPTHWARSAHDLAYAQQRP